MDASHYGGVETEEKTTNSCRKLLSRWVVFSDGDGTPVSKYWAYKIFSCVHVLCLCLFFLLPEPGRCGLYHRHVCQAVECKPMQSPSKSISCSFCKDKTEAWTLLAFISHHEEPAKPDRPTHTHKDLEHGHGMGEHECQGMNVRACNAVGRLHWQTTKDLVDLCRLLMNEVLPFTLTPNRNEHLPVRTYSCYVSLLVLVAIGVAVSGQTILQLLWDAIVGGLALGRAVDFSVR